MLGEGAQPWGLSKPQALFVRIKVSTGLGAGPELRAQEVSEGEGMNDTTSSHASTPNASSKKPGEPLAPDFFSKSYSQDSWGISKYFLKEGHGVHMATTA